MAGPVERASLTKGVAGKHVRHVEPRSLWSNGRRIGIGKALSSGIPAIQMPTCENCGSFVSQGYARVFSPYGHREPRVCPSCLDNLRDGADSRAARSQRLQWIFVMERELMG